MARLVQAGTLASLISINKAEASRRKPHYLMKHGWPVEPNHLMRELAQINGQYVISPEIEAIPAGHIHDMYGDLYEQPSKEYPEGRFIPMKPICEYPQLATYEPAGQDFSPVHSPCAIPAEETIEEREEQPPMTSIIKPPPVAYEFSCAWSHNAPYIHIR